MTRYLGGEEGEKTLRGILEATEKVIGDRAQDILDDGEVDPTEDFLYAIADPKKGCIEVDALFFSAMLEEVLEHRRNLRTLATDVVAMEDALDAMENNDENYRGPSASDAELAALRTAKMLCSEETVILQNKRKKL